MTTGGETLRRAARRLGLGASVAFASGASSSNPQTDAAPAYAAASLHCARFAESSHADIETETAGRTRRSRVEREAVWSIRARDTTGGIALEAWYDSLALRHGSGDSLASPDTDGILGGRYRGLLRPTGEYRRLAAPFVPAQVAEAFDASASLDDLFPRLPPEPLAAGSRWADGEGLEIERLADSTAGDRALFRFVLRQRSDASHTVPRGDTVPVPLDQTTVEEARVVWDPADGLLYRERETVIQASIPAGGRIRWPVRSKVVQRASLRRLRSGRC